MRSAFLKLRAHTRKMIVRKDGKQWPNHRRGINALKVD